MKKLFLFLFISSFAFAQNDTEVYLFDIKVNNGSLNLVNGKNISNNKGYDSQPHFYNDNIILFASTRNGQTDIAKYNVRDHKLSYINSTPNGGEYSPQKIPNSKNISAVRLDNDGLQRFYKYNFKTGKNTELIKDLVVAYPFWYNKNIMISAVIINDGLELFISDLKHKTNTSLAKQVGRSFHKIPNSNLISFMKKNGENWEVWSLNPKTKAQQKIVSTGKSQDVCWLINGSLLIADVSKILSYNPKKNTKPKVFHDFETELGLKNISRIAVNAISSKIAIVAEKN